MLLMVCSVCVDGAIFEGERGTLGERIYYMPIAIAMRIINNTNNVRVVCMECESLYIYIGGLCAVARPGRLFAR